MTDEQKAIIDEAAAEAVAWQREQSATLEEEAKAAFRENGVEMKIVYRCGQINILHDLIREGEGCGFLIENSFLSGHGIVGIPLKEELPVNLYLVWTQTSSRLSVVQKVLKSVRSYLSQ